MSDQGDMRGKAAAFMSASAALGVGVVNGVMPHWVIWPAAIGLVVGLMIFIGG